MTSIRGNHIDRSMYRDLQAANQQPTDRAKEKAIKETLEKNLQDGPMEARNQFVVGEFNALKKFVNDDLPQGELKAALADLLERVPVYDIAAMRMGQPIQAGAASEGTGFKDPAFYHGEWKLSQFSMGEDVSKLTVSPDGSWQVDGEMSGKGDAFGIEDLPQGPSDEGALLRLDMGNGEAMGFFAMKNEGKDYLLAPDPVGGANIVLERA